MALMCGYESVFIIEGTKTSIKAMISLFIDKTIKK